MYDGRVAVVLKLDVDRGAAPTVSPPRHEATEGTPTSGITSPGGGSESATHPVKTSARPGAAP